MYFDNVKAFRISNFTNWCSGAFLYVSIVISVLCLSQLKANILCSSLIEYQVTIIHRSARTVCGGLRKVYACLGKQLHKSENVFFMWKHHIMMADFNASKYVFQLRN